MNSLFDLCEKNQYDSDKFGGSRATERFHYGKKGRYHSYVEGFYGLEFESRRLTTLNLLEIGIHHGGSILMWRDFFENATITAVDIKKSKELDKADQTRIIQIIANGYSDVVIDTLENDFYDIIIDDADHMLPTMCEVVIPKYLPKLKAGGLLIIEDIQNIDWEYTLNKSVPAGYTSRMFCMSTMRQGEPSDSIIYRIEKSLS